MKAAELREKNEQELREQLLELRREHLNLRMQMGLGQLARPHEIRRVRRDVARVETVLAEKARGRS